jgi:protein TonB
VSGALVDVVVLSPDAGLFQSIRDAVGERNPVWRARSAEEAVDLLLTGRCGVLLVDMASVSTNPGSLIEQIRDQFPDVVTLVAGRKDDESLLARLISDGLVYRFMHKPLSPKRAGMFLNAAVRHYVAQSEEPPGESLLPLGPGLAAPTGRVRRALLAVGLAVLLAVIALLVNRSEFFVARTPAPGPSPEGTVVAPRTADPVLASARAALAAKRYESPPGRNALDLYYAVLLARPDNQEARDGLQKSIAAILGQAEQRRAGGDADEAKRLVNRVLAAAPDHQEALRAAAELAPRGPALDDPPAAAPQVAAPGPPTAPAGAGDTPTPFVAAPGTQAPPVADPGAPAAWQTREPPVVRPDPLRPAQTQRASPPPPRPLAVPMQGPGSFGGPISSGHPTAGIDDEPPAPAEAGTAAAAATQARGFEIATPLQAVGELERLYAPDPVYPPQALRDGVEGWVQMEFTVTETGAVGDVLVLDSRPAGVFERAAIEAVASWRFRPRAVNGRPVQQRSAITIRFEVEG